MKKIISLTILAIISTSIIGQAPQKFSFQAVIRDVNNEIVDNENVGIQISIISDSVNGTVEYLEEHEEVTNTNGLVTLEIGTGNSDDNFESVDWSAGTHFLKIEADPNGGANYSMESINQILSVPYAIHASTSNSAINENQTLADVLSLGNMANTQIKNLSDPTDAQDAVTKSYINFSTSKYGDTLSIGPQWVIIPGISAANNLNVINGDFEMNELEDCDYNNSNEEFNAVMPYVFSNGVSEEIDIHTHGCYVDPQSNDWCVGLASRSVGGHDAINLQLSEKLEIGTTYKISFWTFGNTSSSEVTDPIELGLSNTDSTFGNVEYIALPEENVWEYHEKTFTSDDEYKYISVRMKEDSPSTTWVQVDSFDIQEIEQLNNKKKSLKKSSRSLMNTTPPSNKVE